MGYPWDILRAQEKLLTHTFIHPTASVHPTARIDGPVYIGPKAIVAARVLLQGPCTLSDGVYVGKDGSIIASHIGRNSYI